ncbi:MAG: hypothetical protein V3T84_15310 [Phycisphaerales bacterium]
MNIAKSILCARALRPWLVALVVVAGLRGLTNRCLAQSGNNLLPDPISSRELAGYLDRLQLTDEQRLAIEPVHEQYLGAFRTLREGAIQRVLDEIRVLSDGSTGLPAPGPVEKFLRNLDRVLARIKQADNRLFSEIGTILTEQQRPALSRIKLTRARKRLRSGLVQGGVFLNRGDQVNLSKLYEQLELTPQLRQISDPLIIQHERVLTSRLKDLRDAGNRMILDMVIAFEELGFSQRDTSDPEALRKTFLAFDPVRTELAKNLLEPASAISNLNRKTIQRLTQVLQRPQARELRRTYYLAAYPEARYDLHSAQKRFTAALQMNDLTEQLRETVTALGDDHQRSHDKITEEMVDQLDDLGGKMIMIDFDNEQWAALQQQMNAFEARWAQLNTTARESLDAVLGPQLVAMLGDRAGRTSQGKPKKFTPAGVVVEASNGGVVMRTNAGDILGADALVPNPISERQLTRFAQRLALSNEQQAIVGQLHEHYVAQYRAHRAAQRKAAQTAQARNGDPGTDEARQMRLHQQRQALQEAQELDATLFDDLALAFGESPALPNELQRLKLARRRAIFSRREAGFRLYLSPVQSHEAWVDLSGLVDELQLDAETARELDDIMREYEGTVTPAFEVRHEAAIAAQLNHLNAMINLARFREESEDVAADARDELRQAEITAYHSTHEAEQAVIQINRETLQRILQTLAGPSGQALQRAYNRKAFPSVYNNPESAERFITAAGRLADLSDQQRHAIQTISREYRDAYEPLGGQMAILSERGGAALGVYDDPAVLRDYRRRRQELALLEFDRQELDAKALRRVRSILTPEQLARLNLTPKSADLGKTRSPEP